MAPNWRVKEASSTVEIGVVSGGGVDIGGRLVPRSSCCARANPAGDTLRADVFDGIRICTNNCDFCFVYQNRRRMRKSVYVKDDDYRLSFLHGDFITLTNLTESCWERIFRYHLSPLYVSIHATDPG